MKPAGAAVKLDVSAKTARKVRCPGCGAFYLAPRPSGGCEGGEVNHKAPQPRTLADWLSALRASGWEGKRRGREWCGLKATLPTVYPRESTGFGPGPGPDRQAAMPLTHVRATD